MEYEVGQKVRCINSQSSLIENGKIYTIKKIWGYPHVYAQLREINKHHSFDVDRFEPIQPAGPKYKKGDTVKIIGNTSGHCYEDGDVVTLTDTCGDTGWHTGRSQGVVNEKDLELVESNNKIEREDVMTRAKRADENDEKVKELQEEIAQKKEHIERLEAETVRLREYPTDRAENVAQVMLAKGVEKDQAEAILDLLDKGIK